jgi:regulator of sigma E protease
MVYQVYMVVLLVVGFGLVVFVHEMGHFLAAKWMDVKVEQFALGFGPAICSWRKGMGWVRGSSGEKFQQTLKKHIADRQLQGSSLKDRSTEPTSRQLEAAARELAMSETEYRLNWFPLGGYVKMLGQDDLKPGAESEDPRAFNRKSIRARMVIVSAGVFMNVVFAALGFMALFLIGFHTPAPIVGGLLSDSPAQRAGLHVGDRIVTIDGGAQPDFTRISLTTALLQEGKEANVVVDRPGQGTMTFSVRPERLEHKLKGLLSFGMNMPLTLQGPPIEMQKDWKEPGAGDNPESFVLRPGEVITAINGQTVGRNDLVKLDESLQSSQGHPLTLSLTAADGHVRTAQVQPHFQEPFGTVPLNFAGLQPRVAVEAVSEDSKAFDKIQVGDIITRAQGEGSFENPSSEQFLALVKSTSAARKNVTLEVLRNSKPVELAAIAPTTKLDSDSSTRGLGIGMTSDDLHAITAAPLPDSSAARAKIPASAQIVSIDSQSVQNWFDVRRLLEAAGPIPDHANQHALLIAGSPTPITLQLSDDDLQNLHNMRLTHWLDLQQQIIVLKTRNPLQAAIWGVYETRDFILQFYVTLRRMFEGSVSVHNVMGPIGMVYAGARLAFGGFDKLLWFLSLISADLAVVNFLPIPVVDGGLFAFLILEKIQGRPLSNRAQTAWQVVGLVLILGVFVLVTCQDISRFLP